MESEQKNIFTLNSELYRPQFSSEWDNRVLYDLSEWVNGMTFRNIHFSPIGKPVIKIAEIKNGISGQTKFTEAEYDPIYHVTDGDMLFSWSGQPETSIDVFRWRGPDGWLNQHIFKVHPKAGCQELYFFYLLKYLNQNFVRIARNKQTTGLGHVTKKDLQNITVGIPSDRSN
jgi:type I restriction enzyme S subunit